ncbi:CotH kinase family protein [Fibrobacter sp. UWB12]|uniref:CotH kinase family protein n=1 Tax=Fibrobacter sp. UWB12 TaxID=1896203 RepID=UPI000922F2D1|nr:CotH kinase family protein [Fibrobacter sp. UWB12]SHK74829.1 Lamin Tail Domain [Fibrobacter sp. UWB12]
MIRSKKWIREILSLAAVFGTAFVVGCADDNNEGAFNAPQQGGQCLNANGCGTSNPKVSSSSMYPYSSSMDIIQIVTSSNDTIRDTIINYLPPDTALRWIGQSALRITEISPLNLDWFDEEGNDPSWVEIYNSSDQDVDLEGYTLVENLKNLRKWVFGRDVLKAKSFRVVFCDKKNISSVAIADNGDRHTRPHTNWKLDKNGGTLYLVDKFNGIRDSVAYPELTAGLSWGIVDGGYWKYFEKATPEQPNTSKSYDEIVPDADMSGLKSGFYNEAFTLNPPSLAEGVKLRCTTDGSVPTENSPEFNSPKRIDHSVAFRCAAFKKGALSSKVTTRTFFVDEEAVKMPIVAISVDSSFFREHYIKTKCDAPRGCADSAGLYADVEYPIHVEYFEKGSSTKDGSTWEKDAGISLMGGYSRLNDKKSVSIRLREEYEDGSINYPLFETRKGVNDKYKSFNLRNNGNRYVSDYIEDAMGGALLEGTSVDYQRSRQVVVFYNGKYYGIHDMRERFNKHYVETNYKIDANSVNFIKHLGKEVEASNGTIDAYNNMLHFVATNDFSGENNANYAAAKLLLDVGNLADYMAAEIYMHNGDWPNNNVRAWSAPEHPWKFMVYDLDHGFDWMWGVNGGEFDQSSNMFAWIKKGGGNKPCKEEGCFANLYNQLIKNPEFKRMFINRSALMFNSYTNGKNVEKIVDAMVSTIDNNEMTRDLEKFKQNERYYQNSCGHGFDKTGSCMKEWAGKRDSKVISEYEEEFGLSGMATVTIAASGSGSVLMEGATLPSKEFKGKFFVGNPILLTAVSAGGTFTGWSDGVTDNPRLVEPKEGATFTAQFQ